MKNVIATKLLTPFVASLLVSSLLIGCSKDENKNTELVTYKDLQLEVFTDVALTAQQNEILAKVNAEQPIEFSLISNALIEEHAASFQNKQERQKNREGVTTTDVKDTSFYASVVQNSLDLHVRGVINLDGKLEDTKVEVEKMLVNVSGKELFYNIAANSPLDVYLNNRMQCYSGTVFMQFQWRAGRRNQFVDKNPVVIYEFGHILPGYMIKTDEGYALLGIETTVGGKAVKNYGQVKKLNLPMRIVDAEIFALIEIFKSKVRNGDSLLTSALEQTAKKYGIPLNDLEARVSENAGLTLDGRSTDKNNIFLNSDFMMFGNINSAPQGDVARSYNDTLYGPGDAVLAQPRLAQGENVDNLTDGAGPTLGESQITQQVLDSPIQGQNIDSLGVLDNRGSGWEVRSDKKGEITFGNRTSLLIRGETAKDGYTNFNIISGKDVPAFSKKLRDVMHSLNIAALEQQRCLKDQNCAFVAASNCKEAGCLEFANAVATMGRSQGNAEKYLESMFSDIRMTTAKCKVRADDTHALLENLRFLGEELMFSASARRIYSMDCLNDDKEIKVNIEGGSFGLSSMGPLAIGKAKRNGFTADIVEVYLNIF